MKAPAFWRGPGLSWQAVVLAPPGWVYGAATLLRLRRKGWRAPVPVIAIGNFTAGGAGKTPTALAIGAALTTRGENPFFITRGYGGTEAGPHRVDADDAARVGDEALLLARLAPTIVARDRAAGARRALTEGATCLVLDDALQNPGLVKDFSIGVVDGGAGFGNGLTLPAGPMRAPLGPMLRHTDLVLVVGEDLSGIARTIAGRKPVLAARMVADDAARDLAGRRVLAFSGIALPEKFERTLGELGVVLTAHRRFEDHHRFTQGEAAGLIAEARAGDAVLVTTEKDLVRLDRDGAAGELARLARAVPVRLVAEAALFEAVYRALDAARRR